MTKQTKVFLINMVEKELEEELTYLENEKAECTTELEDDLFNYAYDLRNALGDLYLSDLRQRKGVEKFASSIIYEEEMKKINERLKALKGE